MKRRKPLRVTRGLTPDPEKVREFMQRGRKAANRPGVIATCLTCGERFRVSASAADRGEGKYCSRACWPSTPFVERVCENCGATFIVEERLTKNPQRGRFCSRACANGPATSEDGRRAKYLGSRSQTSRFVSGQAECVHPACNAPRARAHEHHVVYEQHVRAEGGDRCDPRNALRLCASCHSSHHRRGSKIVPLTALRDENYEFAFELLGAAAFDYLRRRYSGDDPRLHVWLRRVEAAAAGSGDSHEEAGRAERRAGHRPEGEGRGP